MSALLFVALAVLWALPSAASAADSPLPSIFARTARPYGTSYVTWTERYFNWAIGSSAARSPLAHPERCTNNPHGKVFYVSNILFGPPRSVSCTVPPGTPLLISPGGGVCDASDGGPTVPAEIRACAEEFLLDFTGFQVTIDTIEIPLIDRFRIETPVFNMVYQPGNIWGTRPGAYPGVAIAPMLMVRPLPKGLHTIVLHDESVSGQYAELRMQLRVV